MSDYVESTLSADRPVVDVTSPYTVGTNSPKPVRDGGAGIWNSQPKTTELWAKRGAIIQILGVAHLTIGKDASDHMEHYLVKNSGELLRVDFKRLLADVKSAQALFEQHQAWARKFIQTLPNGEHDIVTKETSIGYCQQAESTNWFYAVGGFHCWGKGRASVQGMRGFRRYTLSFNFLFSDRYNWDTGKQVTIAGVVITDKFMGDFHRQGRAQEFNMDGSVTVNLAWKDS